VANPFSINFKVVNLVGVAFVWMAILILPVNVWWRGRLNTACMKTGKVVEYHYKTDDGTLIRCDANHPCMQLREKKSMWETHKEGKISETLSNQNAIKAEKIIRQWQIDLPGEAIGKVLPETGHVFVELRHSFMKNEIDKTPQGDVNVKYPEDKNKPGVMDDFLAKQNRDYGEHFPTDTHTNTPRTAADYKDLKKFPNFQFLKHQVKVGLAAPEKNDPADPDKKVKDVNVMHPRLRSVWREAEDTGETLQVRGARVRAFGCALSDFGARGWFIGFPFVPLENDLSYVPNVVICYCYHNTDCLRAEVAKVWGGCVRPKVRQDRFQASEDQGYAWNHFHFAS
jgi:hypothetical protein